MSRPRYSFVIPVYNEEELLGELHARLDATLDALDGEAEVILVDDGSTDGTYRKLRELNERDRRFKVIRFARNFGHQLAITAGLDFTLGDAVIVMDGDLQDPPEVVFQLIERWREGYEVVYAVRGDRRSDPLLKRITARLYYRVLRRLSDVEIPPDVGDFRLVDRKAVDEFKAMRERNRYVRGMFAWVGFRQTGVTYSRPQRFAGTTKYPYRRSLKLAVDGLISFSNLPLRAALTLGFLVSAGAFVAGVAALIGKLVGAYDAVPGWASIVVVVAFLGGVQLIVVGMMGLYIARIYDEVRRRPLYIVRDSAGFAAPAPSGSAAVGERAPLSDLSA